MAWMMDTYSMQKGYAVPEIVTGKPISIGGSVFRHEATGVGVVMVIDRACERLGWNLADQRCVVQGFGNVGGVAARDLAASGAPVIARLGSFRRRRRRRRPRRRRRCTRGSTSTARSPTIPTRGTSRTRSCSSFRATSSCSPRARISSRRRTRAASTQAHRGGSERADVDRGRRDPRRARHSRAAGRAHERGRRHRLVLRVGAGPRPPVLGPRGDPRRASPRSSPTRSTASGSSPRSAGSRCAARRSSPASARSRRALEARGIYP